MGKYKSYDDGAIRVITVPIKRPVTGGAMHILCPHCRNPIELVKLSAEEIFCPTCGSSFKLETGSTTGYSPKEDQRKRKVN